MRDGGRAGVYIGEEGKGIIIMVRRRVSSGFLGHHGRLAISLSLFFFGFCFFFCATTDLTALNSWFGIRAH